MVVVVTYRLPAIRLVRSAVGTRQQWAEWVVSGCMPHACCFKLSSNFRHQQKRNLRHSSMWHQHECIYIYLADLAYCNVAVHHSLFGIVTYGVLPHIRSWTFVGVFQFLLAAECSLCSFSQADILTLKPVCLGERILHSLLIALNSYQIWDAVSYFPFTYY